MKIKKFSKKTYFLGFVFVMLANICLTIFVMHNILAQTADDKFKEQPPITAEVVKQNDSPLLVTIINVDNSNPHFQLVNYSVQNVSGKPLKGFVIWAKGKNTGKIITDFFPAKPFQVNAISTGEIAFERENIKSDESILVSVDYTRFIDGEFWGEDLQQQSESISGAVAGEEFAIERIKKLIGEDQATVITSMLEKPLAEVEVTIPDEFKARSEKWQKGFSNGYKGIISFLKSLDKKEGKNYLEKLAELQRNLQNERRQKQ